MYFSEESLLITNLTLSVSSINVSFLKPYEAEVSVYPHIVLPSPPTQMKPQHLSDEQKRKKERGYKVMGW
jgi:hypothetical protein